MQMVTVTEKIRFADEAMQKIGLFETDRFCVDLSCLEPGQAQKAHAHAGSDKVYYVLGGRARVAVGPERQELTAGQAVLAPSGAEHGVANAAEEPLILLTFMAPKPTR